MAANGTIHIKCSLYIPPSIMSTTIHARVIKIDKRLAPQNAIAQLVNNVIMNVIMVSLPPLPQGDLTHCIVD